VCGHDRCHVGGNRGAKRLELDGTEPLGRVLEEAQLLRRALRNVAKTGKVLAAGPHAARLQLFDDGRGQQGHHIGRICQRPIAQVTILRIREDVEHGRKVERDPDRAQFSGERACEPPGELGLPRAAERGHWRPRREAALEDRDPPAFLIDGGPCRKLAAKRRDLAGEVGDLFGLLDVPPGQDDPVQRELAGERSQLRREAVSVESGNEQLADVLSQRAG